MSSIANLTSAPAVLPPVNIHPHGHKKGLRVESIGDSSSGAAAQIPAGSAQNLFGSLLHSLEQVIGAHWTTAATATPVTTATPVATGANTTASTAAAAPTSASSLLQNYLNNLSQHVQANGSQMPKLAGSNVSVNA
jgi:hypothetical protein